MPRKKRAVEGCAMDMTPMIDVVFQLIIFFIVTMSMVKKINEDIYLADGKYGEIIKEMPPSTFEIEVDKDGRITIKGSRPITLEMLNGMLKFRADRYRDASGYPSFPVLIRADHRAKHADIKRVMDACTYNGLWKLNFVAVEKRARR